MGLVPLQEETWERWSRFWPCEDTPREGSCQQVRNWFLTRCQLFWHLDLEPPEPWEINVCLNHPVYGIFYTNQAKIEKSELGLEDEYVFQIVKEKRASQAELTHMQSLEIWSSMLCLENYTLVCEARAQSIRDRVAGNESKEVGRAQIMEGLVSHAKELAACG